MDDQIQSLRDRINRVSLERRSEATKMRRRSISAHALKNLLWMIAAFTAVAMIGTMILFL
jgi:hypothetical protein